MAINVDSLYIDLHQHPELSFGETRTAGIVASHLIDLRFDVTEQVGRTGVVGVLENGPGPVVYLRADMDGLPVREETGLPYASTVIAADAAGDDVPVMHACGHDVHVACLVGAAEWFATNTDAWSGTLVTIFQPAEEVMGGARAMLADGLLEQFPFPDVVLGQHVSPLPAGAYAVRGGPAMAGVDTLNITFTGRGGHGSRPQTTIDPIVAASAAVLRLQTIVSREVQPGDLAVVTVGTFNAGLKHNIIPATATLGLSIRSLNAASRDRILGSVERIVRAEAAASGMTTEPTITPLESGPATINDEAAAARVTDAFADAFGAGGLMDIGVSSGSEDVGTFATAAGVPLVFWMFGGTDPDRFMRAAAAGTLDSDIPSNHSPFFAPVIQPTLNNGVALLRVAALEWLKK